METYVESLSIYLSIWNTWKIHFLPAKDFITSSTENVIYLKKCPLVKIYIGETTEMLKQRISGHKRSISSNDVDY